MYEAKGYLMKGLFKPYDSEFQVLLVSFGPNAEAADKNAVH